jgi:hypothetical protein
MENIKDKFKVDIEKLKTQNISVLKAVLREGERHLRYYYSTMSVFKHPESRVKTQDTVYYEEVVPIIVEILQQK